MARLFVRTSSQNLSFAGGIATAAPLSFSTWIKPTSSSVFAMDIMSITDGGAVANGYILRQDSTGHIAALTVASTTVGTSTSAGTVVNGTYVQAGAMFTSATSRQAVLAGVLATVEATNLTPAPINTTQVGSSFAPQNFYDGSIAEAGMWTVALSQADWTSLALGVSPSLIRPDKLLAYWKILGNSPEVDLMTTAHVLTVNNAPAVSAHPVTFYPSNKGVSLQRAGAPPTPLAPFVLTASTQWKLQRFDMKPRREERA